MNGALRLVLFGVVVLSAALLALHQGVGETEPAEDDTRWAQRMERLAEAEAAAPTRGAPALRPAADSAFLRRDGVPARIAQRADYRALRAAFVAAHLANSPDAARDHLAGVIAADPDADVRARARLAVARVSLRAGDAGETRAALRQVNDALDEALSTPQLAADALALRSIAHARLGDTRAALDDARGSLAIDADSIAAHIIHVNAYLAVLRRRGVLADPDAFEAIYDSLEYLGRQPDRGLARDTRDAFSARRVGGGGPAGRLAEAYAAAVVGDRPAASEAVQAGLAVCARDGCDPALARRLVSLADAIEARP